MMEFSVSIMTEGDLPGAAALEGEVFHEPWSENALRMLLQPNAFGIVCRAGDTVAAYGGMICVLDEGQITNIGTLPQFRRLGLARRTLEAMLEEANRRELTFVTLEVRESNSAAIGLYEKLGFSAIGKRQGLYRFPTEAAVIMEKKL